MRIIATIGAAGLVATAGLASAQTAPGAQSLGAEEFSCAHLVAMAPDEAERMLYFIAGRMTETRGGAEPAQEGGPATLGDAEPGEPQFDPRLMQLTPVDAVGFFEIDTEAIWAACLDASEGSVADLIEERLPDAPASTQ